MHGVSKTALNDEQKEAKRLERQKKQERFVKVRDTILKKIKEHEYDDEGLKMTGAILAANPDLYIFWNYRKRAILSIVERDTADRIADQDSASSDVQQQQQEQQSKVDGIENYFRNELSLTEECLRDNPKSYAVWYHRQWILEKLFERTSQKEELIKSELRHCAEALKYDERNFHSWDHRRFVSRLGSVPEIEESKFTKEKIDENFSNYSAWHYRSSLLPRLFPPTKEHDSVLRLEESKLNEELSYAQNAFFTDPEDQSAWFYHCWLFRPSDEKRDESIFLRYFNFNRNDPAVVVLLFNRLVKIDNRRSIRLSIDDQLFSMDDGWSNAVGTRTNLLWTNYTISDRLQKLLRGNCSVKVYFGEDLVGEFEIGYDNESSSIRWIFPSTNDSSWKNRFVDTLQPKLPSAFGEALENSMNSCRELKSLEPTSNKWPLLTEILSMRWLDLSRYRTEIRNGLDQLARVDQSKLNYYDDLKSKFIFESRLLERGQESVSGGLEISSAELTTLPPIGSIILLINITDLNLNDNRLVFVVQLGHLINLIGLRLDRNLLIDTRGLDNLRHLTSLSIGSNRLGPKCVDSLTPLKKCSNLKKLFLNENPLCENETDSSVLDFFGKSKIQLEIVI